MKLRSTQEVEKSDMDDVAEAILKIKDNAENI
jgi:hypothetical protein